MKYKLKRKIKALLGLTMCLSIFAQSIPVYGMGTAEDTKAEIGEEENAKAEAGKTEEKSGRLIICLEDGCGSITVSVSGQKDVVVKKPGEKKELTYPVGTEVQVTAEASDSCEISKMEIDKDTVSGLEDPAKYQKKFSIKEEKTVVKVSFTEQSGQDAVPKASEDPAEKGNDSKPADVSGTENDISKPADASKTENDISNPTDTSKTADASKTEDTSPDPKEHDAAASSPSAMLAALLSDTDAADDAEDGDVDEVQDTEEEGEDIPDGTVDYGTGNGTVQYTVGKHGKVTVDGEKLTSSQTISYAAGTRVALAAKADTGYDIDEIYILDESGNYLDYTVGFDTPNSHSMTFSVYGGMAQSVHVTFTEEEKEDPFDGAEGAVRFKKTIDTSFSRIDGGTVYRGANGELAYCGNAHAHAPGTDGKAMKLDTNSAYQHAFDYIMYYGYPNHTTIFGTKYSKKDAHDITQWAIWLIRNPNYYRGTFAANPTLAAVSKKIAAKAREYKGGNEKIDGTCLVYYPSSQKTQPMIILNENRTTTGKLKLKKSSDHAAVTDGNAYYTLKGAGYVVYSDSACKDKVAALETKKDGSTDAVELKTGTYYVKEATAPAGYTVSNTKSKVKIKTGTTTTLKVKETPGTAFLYLKKESANTGITDGNGCYDLSGAVYTVYTDAACTTQAKDVNGNAASFVTNTDGSAPELELYLGDYWVRETRAAEGYALDSAIYAVSVKEKEKHYKVNKDSVKDEPKSGYLDILLQKVDKETKKAVPQGSASLKAAEFAVQYYDGKYSIEEAKQHQAKRTWKFRTDESGKVKFTDDPAYYIGGDPLYRDSDGNVTLPLGTAIITETKAPEGYLVNRTARKIWIESDQPVQNASVGNYAVGEYAVDDQILRMDLQIMKYGEKKDEDFSGVRKPLKDVEFTITSKTTGEQWKIITDENGIASTKQLGISDRGNLVYDTYIVEETKNPYREYGMAKPFEAVLKPSEKEDGKTYYYGIVNTEICSPIQVVKKDSSTGKTIPIADAEFQILDADKNVMELTISHYPKKVTATSFRTDETGTFTFPELFGGGTYYLKEIHAPHGYLLQEELLEITIDEEHDWEEPLVIEFPNANEMGQITLTKTDAETAEKIAGAEYTVTAAEDIVTPEGTVRLEKGETADVFTTDADGKGVSEELFLGRYNVRETRAPQGYVLDTTMYGVELTYQGEQIPVVKHDLGEIQNKPTTIVVNKVKKGTDLSLGGVAFQVWNADMIPEAAEDPENPEISVNPGDVENPEISGNPGNVENPEISGNPGDVENPAISENQQDPAEWIDAGMAMKETLMTDENGQIRLRYLSPGTYKLQEVQALPGYILDDTVYTFVVDEYGRTEGLELYELTIENEDTRMIGTTAKDTLTGTNDGIARDQAGITDTVAFENLIPGTVYRVRGKLMDKQTREPLLIGGREVTAETVFTAEQSKGTVDVVFNLDASGLRGADIVVFEKAYLAEGEIEIARHEDFEDEGQTITYNDPSIGTTAVNQEDGTHTARPGKVTIVDTVAYKGLAAGVMYTVKGILMDQEKEKPLQIEGKAVEAEAEFKAEGEEGTVQVTFTFDASALGGKNLVAFEDLYVSGTDILVAYHRDLRDTSQTVSIQRKEQPRTPEKKNPPKDKKIKKVPKSVPKTGDMTNVRGYAMLLTVSAILLAGIVLFHRKLKKD